MSAAFDPKTFLDVTINEQGSTEVVPVPIGDYYAIIDKVDTRSWQSRNDPSKSGVALDVQYSLELTEEAKQILGRDKATVTQGIMLDLLENGAGLDMGKGKNVTLNRLREACDLNRAGQPFNFRMFVGKMVKVKIGHRPSDDGTTIYTDVKAVTKPS